MSGPEECGPRPLKWAKVFDVREETRTVEAIQYATLNTPDHGLLPEPALFGTDGWWDAVADGRVPTFTKEGVVADVRWESKGDWPGWTFRGHDGSESRWTREGDWTRYVVGLGARITWAVVSWKPTAPGLKYGEPLLHDMLIRVDLEESDQRSPKRAPGPVRAGEAP